MTMHMPFPVDADMNGVQTVTARVVPLSDSRSAIFFDVDSVSLFRGARIVALSDGRPFDGPIATSRLDRPDGGLRIVLLVARSAEQICRSSVTIEASGALVARIDPLALQSPLSDPLALIAGLDETGCLRLLKLLLTTGASLFGKGDLGGFGVLVGQLVEGLTSPVPLSAWCPVGLWSSVLSWRQPAGLTLPALRDVCVLHNRRTYRFTNFVAFEETVGTERLLHFLVSRPLPEGADLIVLGDRPVRLAGPAGTQARPLHGWMERRKPEIRVRTLAWLDEMAAGDASVSSLRDELACPPGCEPRLGVLHLSETPAGLLYLLSVEDPRGLLAGVRVTAAGQSIDLSCDVVEWHSRQGAVITGFQPASGRSGGAATVAPVFRSGRIGAAIEAATATFDGTVPEVFRGLPAAIAARTLAQALPSAVRSRPVWRRRVTTYGDGPGAPRMALVLAAGDMPEHLHAALKLLVGEPGGRNVEIVIHHTDGPATEMIRQTAESLSAIHRVGIRLVAVPAEAFPSERLRAALAETRAPKVLALGPGCLPSAPGWLASWRRRIGSDAAPRLLETSATTCNGARRDPGDVVGLNAATVARLISARPTLPGIGADLAATAGLERTSARGPVVTVYESGAPDELALEAERVAAAAMLEGAQ